MPISFNLIPNDVRVPGAYLEIDNTQAVRGLPGMPSRILVLGQKLSAGTATANVPVQVLSDKQAESLFGRGSMLHRMFVTLKANNRYTETWAIPQVDADEGVQASGTVTFGGTVTLAGTLNLYIAGKRVRIAIADSETAAASATKLAAAINAVTDLPVTAAVNGSVTAQVDITARHKGENGNSIDIRTNYYQGETTPQGRTVTIVAMSGGSGNPDVSSAITAFGTQWWTDIICPWTDSANLADLETEMTARFGPMIMKDGHVYCAASGSHATLVTLASTRNSPHVSIMGAYRSPTTPEEWAAAYGSVCAYHAKIDPARPFQTLPLVGVLPPSIADRFEWTDRNLLLFAGIATFSVDDGGRVLIERVITNYQTNGAGVDDISYLDLETLKTVAYIRYVVRARILLRYPRHKLANDGTNFGAGQAIVTPRTIRGELIALFRELESAGIVENLDQFKADLIVERNASDPNRVDAIVPPDLVNQMRCFSGLVQFLL